MPWSSSDQWGQGEDFQPEVFLGPQTCMFDSSVLFIVSRSPVAQSGDDLVAGTEEEAVSFSFTPL